MSLVLDKYHYYWIVIWFFVLVYLVLNDAIFSQKLTHTQIFSQNQFEISYVFPLGRTQVDDDAQVILDEPVYITVYTPLRYKEAKMNLNFAESPEGWSIGLQTGPGFSYTITSLDERQEQELIFNTTDAYYNKNKIRFIFSNTEKTISPLTLQHISITLTKPYGGYSRAIKENIFTTYEKIAAIF